MAIIYERLNNAVLKAVHAALAGKSSRPRIEYTAFNDFTFYCVNNFCGVVIPAKYDVFDTEHNEVFNGSQVGHIVLHESYAQVIKPTNMIYPDGKDNIIEFAGDGFKTHVKEQYVKIFGKTSELQFKTKGVMTAVFVYTASSELVGVIMPVKMKESAGV